MSKIIEIKIENLSSAEIRAFKQLFDRLDAIQVRKNSYTKAQTENEFYCEEFKVDKEISWEDDISGDLIREYCRITFATNLTIIKGYQKKIFYFSASTLGDLHHAIAYVFLNLTQNPI